MEATEGILGVSDDEEEDMNQEQHHLIQGQETHPDLMTLNMGSSTY